MRFSIRREDPRVHALVVGLHRDGTSAAETWRQVGEAAEELGIARPSYHTIRELVRAEELRRRARSATRQAALAALGAVASPRVVDVPVALDALELARAGSSVTLVHRSQALTARHDIVEQVRREPRIDELPGWELASLEGGDRLEAVTLVRHADGERRRVEAGGLVVKVARVPRTDLFRGQIELDRAGAIVVDGDLQTSCAGVFAAGDVVSGAYARIAAAMGQGSLAARSVLRHLQGRR